MNKRIYPSKGPMCLSSCTLRNQNHNIFQTKDDCFFLNVLKILEKVDLPSTEIISLSRLVVERGLSKGDSKNIFELTHLIACLRNPKSL